MSPREAQLVDVTRLARDYFAAVAAGQYISDHRDLQIGRELTRVLALYDETDACVSATENFEVRR